MAQLVVRGLDDEVMKRLKQRATLHGRSLEGEVRALIESAAGFSAAEARQALGRWQKKLAGRELAGSRELLDEDRRR